MKSQSDRKGDQTVEAWLVAWPPVEHRAYEQIGAGNLKEAQKRAFEDDKKNF